MSKRRTHFFRSWRTALGTLVFAFILLLCAYSQHAVGTGNNWYRVVLQSGTVDGYEWAVGAKGPRHEPLSEICGLVAIVDLATAEDPYPEATSSEGCSTVERPAESVVENASMGSGESRLLVLAAFFRPAVRKAILVFSTGERKVLRPLMAKISGRQAKGVPQFRYLAVPFEGEARLRKTLLFDGKGNAINR